MSNFIAPVAQPSFAGCTSADDPLTKRPFDQLAPELIENIFSFLDRDLLKECRKVCKTWAALAIQPGLPLHSIQIYKEYLELEAQLRSLRSQGSGSEDVQASLAQAVCLAQEQCKSLCIDELFIASLKQTGGGLDDDVIYALLDIPSKSSLCIDVTSMHKG